MSLVFSNWLGAKMTEPLWKTDKNTLILLSKNTSPRSTKTSRSGGRVRARNTNPIKPQYENCKGKDIYKLSSEFSNKASLKATEASGPCVDCVAGSSSEEDSLDEIAETIEEGKSSTQNKSFKEQLRKRVLGQVKTKIALTQIFQKCNEKGNIESQRKWFSERLPKVDWPLMKSVCEKKREDFHTSVKKRWSDMRVSLALSSANPDQIVTGRPHLSFGLSHEVSEFGSIPKLTKEEQRQAKQRWGDHLSKVPLDRLSPEELRTHFIEGRALRKASTKDQREMRKATWELNKESRNRYRKHLDEMPLLAYMNTGDPNNKEEMDEAFSKYMGHLDDLLERIEDQDVDMALLLNFKPLVEGLLADNESYCLAAERARLKAEKEDSLKKWSFAALGVVAAVPCFMTSGLVCLGLGAVVGGLGYKEAREESKGTLERYLTGKEFETMASLEEKDKVAFWQLALLPTAAWGTTAGAVRTIKQLLKKGPSANKLFSARISSNIDGVLIKQVNNVRITRIGHNADTQTDIFKLKLSSSKDDNEVNFDLEIPRKLFKQYRNLLPDIQLAIGQIPAEAFEGLKRINVEATSHVGDFSPVGRVISLNEPVVNAWKTTTAGKSSEMTLTMIPLGRSFYKDSDDGKELVDILGHLLPNNSLRSSDLGKAWKEVIKKDATRLNKFKKQMEEKGVVFVVGATNMLTHIVVKDKVYIIPPSEDTSENI